MTSSSTAAPATDRGRRPKARRTGWRRWAVGLLKWGSLAALVLLVLGAAATYLAYQRVGIPQPNEMANAQVSIVYYADGKTELDRLVVADGNRESVKISAVPKAVQYAHLAAEDRSFYSNNGVSPAGILRAIKSGVSGERQVGGSTITQQYVKNYFLSQDRTLSRKFREILISVKIDGQLSKDQILENYLNTIYYGRGAYGIQSAAKAYFNKSVSQLTVPEGAVLASIINAPTLYDPAAGDKARTNLERRYDYVLGGMVEEGWLTAAERAKYAQLPTIQPVKRSTFGAGPAGYISAEVRKELLTLGLTEDDLAKGGLRITTTVDKKAQDAAVAAMGKDLPQGVRGGLVAVRPGDGAVVAMYAGADYAKSQLNAATQAILQAGSNFKPFAVLAAVRDGISTRTKFDGNSPKQFGNVTINNFGQRSYGQVDMRRMVARSINTAFVELNERVGPAKTRQAAIDAGIPASTPGLDDSLTNVLGSSAPHVIDMASAYSTIASQGVRAKPYLVKSITSTTSDYRYAVKPTSQRAFDKDVTADVTDAMVQTVQPGGTATKLQRLGRPVAGKTGTSEENKSIWFSGFVPQLAVSVGMYKPDAQGNATTMTDSEGYNLTGGTIPADIFLDFLTPVLDGVPVLQFPERVGVGDRRIPPTTTYAPPTTTDLPRTDTPSTTQPPSTPATTAPTSTAGPTATTPPPATTTRRPRTTPTQTRTTTARSGPRPRLTPTPGVAGGSAVAAPVPTTVVGAGSG
ncbi:MAG TPA: transglycosylase domain-containing protein [Intrasporangium sp.]|uniref:transglycosylase domain-containing protein n=1 Tax=Intrasporangium sp. TaxID=1925024 RepID=UPI002D77F2D6|nr:transglycosylase domain-containing protein [Intrasporangium sp.]HET7397514.1 transglycosylase domain-containing protein [Intrasporangium sp.]